MKKYLFIPIICLTSFFHCVPPPSDQFSDEISGKDGIRLRIGIVENTRAIAINLKEPVQIRDQNNRKLGTLNVGDWEVTIQNSSAPPKIFRLLSQRTKDGSRAQEQADKLQQQGLQTSIKTEGRHIRYKGQTLSDNRVYLVYVADTFPTQESAERFRLSTPGAGSMQVIEAYDGEPWGTLVLKNLQDKNTLEFPHTIRLEGNTIILRDVDFGEGFHWQSKENRHYTGTFEIRIDNAGKLTIINELGLERYLRGVVPAEMPDSFPIEALKAQAVAVRSVVLRKLGLAHPDKAFDICDEVHCQVYSGILRENENTGRAVRETAGMVLLHEGQLCDAVYASMCGGHTEASHYIWNGAAVDYLPGVLDQKLKKYPGLGDFLTKEKNARIWIENRPNTFCNHLNSSQNGLASGAAKYFRWEVIYTAQELTKIIKKKTGEDIGRITDIQPLARGVSGRVTSLMLRGTRRSIQIDKELKIRQALSETALYSSCFVVDKLSNGSFKIKGAGLGHGVGMCQYGAAGMALKSKSFMDILYHYYPGTKVNRCYAL